MTRTQTARRIHNHGYALAAQKGFTLIELMVVVTIIAILAAIGLPALNKFVRKAETTDATTVLGDLDKAIRAYASTKSNARAVTDIPAGTTGTALENNLAGYWGKPTNTKFTYTVATITGDASSLTFCLNASATSAAGNSTGQIYWSSSENSGIGWDGRVNLLKYIDSTASVTSNCT